MHCGYHTKSPLEHFGSGTWLDVGTLRNFLLKKGGGRDIMFLFFVVNIVCSRGTLTFLMKNI